MILCLSCRREVPDAARFCSHCGASLEISSAETSTRPAEAPAASRASSAPSLDDARFLPGSMVAGRYRIVGPLGRGGMGEVYRADDLKLGQAVALKFLPEAFQDSEARLQRFLNEVRLSVRITHPNVCRVHDIGEVDGEHFISMEYIDGEDLASLLRRIGRLPWERGAVLARQICAGLAAAHDKGILHRDLKPANIMIDGRGRVRITDFGLAVAGDDELARDCAGTPAYMAPEQLAGGDVTERSDIYALGLVLHEIFTGKPAFEGASTAAELRKQRSSAPTTLASRVEGLDPAIESVILRALDPDPTRRPQSALGLAAALPGGDPLAAALAAGETPSPEMVAEAGAEEGLRKPLAVACLVASLVGLAVVALVHPGNDLLGLTRWTLTPTELSVRAGEIARELGAPERPAFVRDGLMADELYLDWLGERDDSADRWEPVRKARPPAVTYWMRGAPESFEPSDVHAYETSYDRPPLDPPGGFAIRLDTEGRLASFRSRWPEPVADAEAGRAVEVPFERLFELAGLDPSTSRPTVPVLVPPTPSDSLQAWSDTSAVPEVTVHLATLGGRVSWFDVGYPWNHPAIGESGAERERLELRTFVPGLMMLVAIFVARHNLVARRGDRRGAFRLFLFFVFTGLGSWLLFDPRMQDFDVLRIFSQLALGRALAHALLHATMAWVCYLALEPYVRRLWPQTLISWSRLLIHGARDRLVGRDLLVGATLGIAKMTLDSLAIPFSTVLGLPPPMPWLVNRLSFGGPMIGPRTTLGDFLIQAGEWIGIGMIVLLMLMLVRLVTRSNRVTAVVVVVGLGAVGLLSSPQSGLGLVIFGPMMLIALALQVFVTLRFGLLAVASFLFFYHLWIHPMTLDPTAWYAGAAYTALFAAVAMLVFAFRMATGSGSVSGRSLIAGGPRPG